MSVGRSVPRVDAYDKVTGRARYTEDLIPPEALIAKIVRSTVANGRVLRFEMEEALAVPGVVRILTCFDAPAHSFPTAGHPWSTDPGHQDTADRRLLNERVRVFGDEIAVVVAEDSLAAERAARLVRAEYETYPVLLTPAQALAPDAPQLHEDFPGNLLRQSESRVGELSFAQAAEKEGLVRVEGRYETQVVQHCHLECACVYAYEERGRTVVVSATQIPHIVRRVVGQALGIPWGRVRVVKPVIGGGFGNRQDVLCEPLCAWVSRCLGGRTVALVLSREETMTFTRTRHAIEFREQTALRPDGRLVARRVEGLSNQGGYASHGHAILANALNVHRMLYQDETFLELFGRTVYTNLPAAGAMRGYGIPQAIFALESHMDDAALALGLDPIELRLKNCMREGYVDPGTGITCHTSGLRACIEKGQDAIDWARKRKAYSGQTGDLRRGVGMAIFCYKTGVHPISLETASCRMTLNQDGSVQLLVGATEIGQGSDTVLSQMAAEAIGLPVERIHLVSTQDTDVTPFDTGAYASRQTYVSGGAVKQTGELLRGKILAYAGGMLGRPAGELSLQDGFIVDANGARLLSVEQVGMESLYSLSDSVHLSAESSFHCKTNTFAFGACFAEIEVDIPLGKIRVLEILNLHDSGRLINPKLAEAQVHGGMSMGLGYALSEQLLFDEAGRPRNGNLLDYKLPTALDTPELHTAFVETDDPTAPYGNKALGEPPTIPVAAALRNALLHATGVAVNSLPLYPQKLVEHFVSAGLIQGGAPDV